MKYPKARLTCPHRCLSVLADKITKTTAMDDKRVRKELQDNYGKLLDMCVAFVGRSSDQGSWIRRSTKDTLATNGRDSPRPGKLPCNDSVPQLLTSCKMASLLTTKPEIQLVRPSPLMHPKAIPPSCLARSPHSLPYPCYRTCGVSSSRMTGSSTRVAISCITLSTPPCEARQGL